MVPDAIRVAAKQVTGKRNAPTVAIAAGANVLYTMNGFPSNVCESLHGMQNGIIWILIPGIFLDPNTPRGWTSKCFSLRYRLSLRHKRQLSSDLGSTELNNKGLPLKTADPKRFHGAIYDSQLAMLYLPFYTLLSEGVYARGGHRFLPPRRLTCWLRFCFPGFQQVLGAQT